MGIYLTDSNGTALLSDDVGTYLGTYYSGQQVVDNSDESAPPPSVVLAAEVIMEWGYDSPGGGYGRRLTW
jgi:hypothetical protein